MHLDAIWCGRYHPILGIVIPLLLLQLPLLLLMSLLLKVLYLRIQVGETIIWRLSMSESWPMYCGVARSCHGGHLLLHRRVLLQMYRSIMHSCIHRLSLILLHQLHARTLLLIEILEVKLQTIAEAVDTHVEKLLEIILRWHR